MSAERTLALPEGLDRGFVAKSVLATLHHKREARVDGLDGLLRLLGADHGFKSSLQKTYEDKIQHLYRKSRSVA